MARTDPGGRRAAGTERGSGSDTESDTESDTGSDTESDTERGTGPDTERGTESDTERGTGPDTESDRADGPPYSFAALISMAIRASPEQRLPLSGICAYIAGRFPLYRGPGRGWQNSVRLSLSLSPCFRRLPRRHGRAGDWALDPAFQGTFPGGNYRRRCRRSPASSPLLYEIPPGPAALLPPLPPGAAAAAAPRPGAGPRRAGHGGDPRPGARLSPAF